MCRCVENEGKICVQYLCYLNEPHFDNVGMQTSFVDSSMCMCILTDPDLSCVRISFTEQTQCFAVQQQSVRGHCMRSYCSCVHLYNSFSKLIRFLSQLPNNRTQNIKTNKKRMSWQLYDCLSFRNSHGRRRMWRSVLWEERIAWVFQTSETIFLSLLLL